MSVKVPLFKKKKQTGIKQQTVSLSYLKAEDKAVTCQGAHFRVLFSSAISTALSSPNNCCRNTKSPSIPFVGADRLDCNVPDSVLATAHASAQGRASVRVKITRPVDAGGALASPRPTLFI